MTVLNLPGRGAQSRAEYSEVKEKLKKAIAESESLDVKRSGMYTVGEWMDLWYEVYAKPRIRESTSVYYKMFIDTHIRPKLGNIKLNLLQTMDIQRLYNELRENGRIRKEIKDKQPGDASCRKRRKRK